MEISNKVFNSGLYNFQGLKIKLPVFWNIQVLEKLLHNYKDKEIIQFLKYSWPISHDSRRYNTEKIKNWKGALINKTAVKAYLENELKYKSVVGPFKSNPFNQPISILPLNTRDKKDSTEKRIILDLSFPEGLAVNKGINKTTYLGVNVDWRFFFFFFFFFKIFCLDQGPFCRATDCSCFGLCVSFLMGFKSRVDILPALFLACML